MRPFTGFPNEQKLRICRRDAGATAVREPANQFYGDRSAGVTDPVGNYWGIATHVEDVPPDELAKRAEAYKKECAGT